MEKWRDKGFRYYDSLVKHSARTVSHRLSVRPRYHSGGALALYKIKYFNCVLMEDLPPNIKFTLYLSINSYFQN